MGLRRLRACNMETKLPKGGFLHPDRVIEEFDIKEGMKIADFGCGAGYFAIPAAKIVGEKGKVYALDVLKTALESVKSRARAEGLLNIISIWSNLETFNGSKLKDEFVNLALLSNILFQSPKKAGIIKEAKRILKKGGKMIIIEWKKDQPMGPPEKFIVHKDLVSDLAKKESFKFEREFSAGKHHWGIIFIK